MRAAQKLLDRAKATLRPEAAIEGTEGMHEAIDVVDTFLIRAVWDMLTRMRDGLRRGWGTSWQDEDYGDDVAIRRLLTAESHLNDALVNFRMGAVGIDEVRKRAADLANRAFMLADPLRLRRTRGK